VCKCVGNRHGRSLLPKHPRTAESRYQLARCVEFLARVCCLSKCDSSWLAGAWRWARQQQGVTGAFNPERSDSRVSAGAGKMCWVAGYISGVIMFLAKSMPGI
jgi:hypothetical protein